MGRRTLYLMMGCWISCTGSTTQRARYLVVEKESDIIHSNVLPNSSPFENGFQPRRRDWSEWKQVCCCWRNIYNVPHLQKSWILVYGRLLGVTHFILDRLFVRTESTQQANFNAVTCHLCRHHFTLSGAVLKTSFPLLFYRSLTFTDSHSPIQFHGHLKKDASSMTQTLAHAMASQSVSPTKPSSLHPTGFAETILITTIFLGTFCVIAVVLRTWQRIRARSFRVDDAVTWVGLVSHNKDR